MFNPRFTITNLLLANLKRINNLVNELNNRRFPNIVLVELEKTARAVSAHASTSIEGNPLPLTEVKKILKNKPAHLRESEKEIINYNQALKSLDREIESKKASISLKLILSIQKQITKGLLPPLESGQLRKKPVVVNDPKSGQIVYLPPDAKDVGPLLTNLINYTNGHKKIIDPFILAGIFHKQLVIIHPFMDGNGRTSRLATKVLLADMGLNTFNLFSFENYYNQNVTRYFQMVGAIGNYYDLFQKLDFTPWLEYFTEGIIDELTRVSALLPARVLSPKDELKPHHQKIIKFIQQKGFITDKDYSQITNRSKAARTLDFKKLINLGLIERLGAGKNTYYKLKEK